MNTVTIGVVALGDTQRRLAAAFKGSKQGARISFTSEELLWKTLNVKRLNLLKLMAGQDAMSVRELARRSERDVRAVHSDVQLLLKAGVLDRTDGGRIVFPYDAIHVDFVLRAA